MRVLKFGGSALRDGAAVRRATQIVRTEGGARPLVVVSAHHGVTTLLERMAAAAREGLFDWDPLRIRHRTLLRQLGLPGDLLDRHLRELRALLEAIRQNPCQDRRTRDHLLSYGERMSARVFAAALRLEGIQGTPVDAFDLGFTTRAGRPGALAPAPASVGEVLRGVPGVPVVTGFLALDAAGHLTTLGRNGSDLSAVWLAEAVGASEAQLWKTIAGVKTADPRLVPEARSIEALAWTTAAELGRHGSDVLHAGALAPARRAQIPVLVRDVDQPAWSGTRIEGESPVPGPVAIAHRSHLRRLHCPRAGPDQTAQLAELVAREHAHGNEVVLRRHDASGAEVFVARDGHSDPAGNQASAAVIGGGVGHDRELRESLLRATRAAGLEVRFWDAEQEHALVLIAAAGAVVALVRLLHRHCLPSAETRPSRSENDLTLTP